VGCDSLTGSKTLVLAHICEVRANENDGARAKIPHRYHRTDHVYTLPWWGSEIHCRSADKPESLKGPNWAWAVGCAASGMALDDGGWTLGIIVGGYILQRGEEALFLHLFGMQIHIWRRFDSLFRQITARRTQWRQDPKQVARQLTTSVYNMLEKSITFSVPNAVQVLETLRGDCNEHTVLYVALARALGLPARTAVGLVYVNGAFFYHAWPEVWLGEWVAMDPTFGQYPADASHIRFVIGGLAQQVEIVRLIGNLDIEVLGPVATEAE